MDFKEEIFLATVRGMIDGAGAFIAKETDEAIFMNVPRGSKMDNSFLREKIKAFMTGGGVKKKLMFKII